MLLVTFIWDFKLSGGQWPVANGAGDGDYSGHGPGLVPLVSAPGFELVFSGCSPLPHHSPITQQLLTYLLSLHSTSETAQ